MENGTQDRSLRELAAQLPHDVADLVRAEIALMRGELTAAAGRMAAGAALLVVAAGLGLFALGALVAAAILGLAVVWPSWLAALAVGAVLAVLAGALLAAGAFSIRRALRAPVVSTESIREDVEWLRTRTRSGAR
jgi:protein-S-isoprenylcysteine O-methyltransferase Ste14